MNNHAKPTAELTKNQSLVMTTLTQSESALSAYAILDQLRDSGFRAPLQVYRALEKLVEFSMVHRLESINAFIACSHPACDGHKALAFMICDECGRVDEITDHSLANRLKHLADKSSFTLNKATIELHGICQSCQSFQ